MRRVPLVAFLLAMMCCDFCAANPATPVQAPPRSPIQAPPPPVAPSGRVLLLRKAWIGKDRVRGQYIHVVPVAPGVTLDPRSPWRILDPLGIFR